MACVLAIAFLPTLTYVGHWEPRFDIPFTDYYWGLPESLGGHTHDHSDHGDHCHGESSCAGTPTTAGASVALLRDAVVMLAAGGIATLLLMRAWQPGGSLSLLPELLPPRGVLATR